MKFTLSLVALAGLVVAAAAADDNAAAPTAYSTSSAADAASSSSAASDASSAVSASSTGSAASSTGSAASSGSASATGAAPSGSSSASSPASTSTYQPPAGISSQCSGFLTMLDKDESMQNCISPALDILSAGSSSSSPSLSEFCSKMTTSSSSSSSTGCSESAYYRMLSYFTANCTDELVSQPNDDVVKVFDSLYVVVPYSKVVCSKDQLDKYCASSSPAAPANASYQANAAQTPLSDSKGYPNPDAFASENLLFLGYNGDEDAAALCTTCLKNVMSVYVNHEAKRPYPAGLDSSPLMKVQTDLWSAVQSKCPADFITSVVANTGANPDTVNAASSVLTTPIKGVLTVLALIAGVTVV